jgi:hypothetical protein
MAEEEDRAELPVEEEVGLTTDKILLRIVEQRTTEGDA